MLHGEMERKYELTIFLPNSRPNIHSPDKDGDGAIDKGELISAMTNYKFGFSEQVSCR